MVGFSISHENTFHIIRMPHDGIFYRREEPPYSLFQHNISKMLTSCDNVQTLDMTMFSAVTIANEGF